MKVFISWSGAKSGDFALFLHGWIKQVVQAVQPFMSDHDIGKGDRNILAMSQELQSVQFGIVVVTRDTVSAPWINFEAGAISKSIGNGRLVPLLLDVGKSDVAGPLSQFQAVDANDHADVVRMFREINKRLEHPLETEVLLPAVDSKLAEFDAAVARYRESTTSRVDAVALRPDRDVLDEVLLILRELRAAPAVYAVAMPDEPPALTAMPALPSRVHWTQLLRLLDAELDTGKITMGEYRRRRDQLLADVDLDRPQRKGHQR